MNNNEFSQMVYNLVAKIPYGRVTTYGLIALMLGFPQNARQVGQALHNAPQYLDLPCHRVVNHSGKLAPFWPEQRQLLENEGVHFNSFGNVDMNVIMPWIQQNSTQ
jgi:methylated-DNA-protein-cysteine methyltransferase-like protein